MENYNKDLLYKEIYHAAKAGINPSFASSSKNSNFKYLILNPWEIKYIRMNFEKDIDELVKDILK